jgi:hypothetical protein
MGSAGNADNAGDASDTGDTGPQSPTPKASASGPVGKARHAQPTARAARRPGLVTFAAAMLFLEGGFSVVWAIIDFTQPQWLLNVYSAYGFGSPSNTAWAWGFIDLLVGVVSVFAGFSVLRGGAFGQIVGLCIAGFSALRWFFFLPFIPMVALLFIAIDVLVVYGLIAHFDYFVTNDTDPLFGTTQEEPLR